MRVKAIVLSIALLTVAVIVPGVAKAGGWTVVTLDKLPADPVVGKEVRIGFRVLAHGQHGLEGLDAYITAIHQESGRQISFPASDARAPGDYAATINLPEVGTWDWAVVAFEGAHAMFPLQVHSQVHSSEIALGKLVEKQALGHEATASDADVPAGQAPVQEAHTPSGFWNWMAIGSGIAAALAAVAATGIAMGVLPVPVPTHPAG